MTEHEQPEDDAPDPAPRRRQSHNSQLLTFLETLSLWKGKPTPPNELETAIVEVRARAASGSLGAQGLVRTSAEPVKQTRTWLPVTAMVVTLVALVYWMYPRPVVDVLPPEFHGAWKNVHPQYRDRQMWLSATAIAFQVGPTTRDVAIHMVSRLEPRGSRGDTTFHVIAYDVGGGETAEWPVAVVAVGERALIFRNQPGLIWTPAPGPVWPN